MFSSNQTTNIQFSWQEMLWRLVLTALILLILAGSGMTIFEPITTGPNTQVLPPLTYDSPDVNLK